MTDDSHSTSAPGVCPPPSSDKAIGNKFIHRLRGGCTGGKRKLIQRF